jgi:hypothetical protein
MGLRLTRNDLATYAGLSRAGSDFKQGMKDWAMNEAADIKPTQELSQDQARDLEAAAGAKDAEGNSLYQIKGNEGGTYSVTPTAGGETGMTTPGLHRMGGKEQATPFSQEQIESQRFRNQSEVAMRSGDAREAATLQGLAKQREEEGVAKQIRTGAMEGMKNSKDMRDEEKMFSISKGMYEQSLRLGRPDLASGYYNQMTQNRDVLLNKANERADRVFRATGNVSGFVDSYNRYVADDLSIDAFKRNDDGSHVFTVKDGKTGQSREIPVPKERLSEYLLALRDPKRISEIEAKRAEMIFKAQTDAQEALNKPVAIGKDQTLVVPGTGQTFAPRQSGQFDVKEAGPVLDDARKILLERSGNFDQASGKWNWSPETTGKAVIAERLFMKNPSLTPAQLAEVADKGQTGTAVVEVGGKQQRVPAVTYNGRTFILGGSDAGHDAGPSMVAPTSVTTTGLGTRDVRGKIGVPAPGMQKVGPQSSATPSDFPRVSQEQQSSRDSDAGRLMVSELGGINQAQKELSVIDAEIKNKRLDGTQRGILQSYRNRLAAGIASLSQQG